MFAIYVCSKKCLHALIKPISFFPDIIAAATETDLQKLF